MKDFSGKALAKINLDFIELLNGGCNGNSSAILPQN
jgi:hypothetical protein